MRASDNVSGSILFTVDWVGSPNEMAAWLDLADNWAQAEPVAPHFNPHTRTNTLINPKTEGKLKEKPSLLLIGLTAVQP